jgi:hypothetical protein
LSSAEANSKRLFAARPVGLSADCWGAAHSQPRSSGYGQRSQPIDRSDPSLVPVAPRVTCTKFSKWFMGAGPGGARVPRVNMLGVATPRQSRVACGYLRR